MAKPALVARAAFPVGAAEEEVLGACRARSGVLMRGEGTECAGNLEGGRHSAPWRVVPLLVLCACSPAPGEGDAGNDGGDGGAPVEDGTDGGGADAAMPPSGTGRAIAGVSMGGYAAAHLGLAHPELFDVVACAGGLVDMDHFVWLLETHFLGGFTGEEGLGWTYDELPSEGQTVLDRNSLVDFFHDFVRGLGNFATYNPSSPFWPPGLDEGRSGPVLGLHDDEHNPDGTLPAISFLDGEDGDRPMEVLLAIDLDGDGARDPGEPIVRNFREPFRDVGEDGIASAEEPGYDAVRAPDPSGDDYDPLENPSGTEGNLRLDAGEPCDDVGLDGVAKTGASGWDFGEANGICDENPNLAGYWLADPRRLASGVDFGRLAVWLDAGIRDVFEFDVGTDRFAGELERLGVSVGRLEAFDELPGAGPWFDAAAVDWASVPDHVYVRYGNPAATPKQIADGDGGHVGDVETVYRRFVSMVHFIANRLGGDLETRQDQGVSRLETFYSAALEREVTYAVFLPPGYDARPDLEYAVLYFLHGYGQEPEDLVGVLGMFLGMAMRDGVMEKLIVVVPDGRSFEDTGSAYVNRVAPVPGDTGRYEDYVTDDLFAHVESTYRTRTGARR